MFTSKRALAKICKFISANAHLGSLAARDTSPPYSGSLYDALHVLIREYNQKHNSHGEHSYVPRESYVFDYTRVSIHVKHHTVIQNMAVMYREQQEILNAH